MNRHDIHMKLCYTVRAALLTGLSLAVAGCGDFFAQKPTEIQSRAILDELSQVRETEEASNPLPDIYLQPTSRLAIKDGVKLFYFTKHHPAETLAQLIQDQLEITSTVNASTNQIVAYCKDDAQAEAVENYLKIVDVAPVQVNIDCLILERFGDVTMDWETSLLVEEFLGMDVTLGEGKYPNPVFPGASLRETDRSNFGLDFGLWVNQGLSGKQIHAVVDVLVSRGYLKILLNPQVETINAKKASVTIKDLSPIEEVRTSSAGASGVYNITKYVWVEDTLTVTPYVYSDGSVGLTTDIKIGSRSKPEGVVQRSIITEREINIEENRIEPGKSLIIGGMRKSERRSVVRGIPFFKDLPLLGVLFSSKDFEESGTEIIFILTPSISSGGVENAQMVSELRDKYAEPASTGSWHEMLVESFGKDRFTQLLEKEAANAELARIQAETDLEQAQQQAAQEKVLADKADEKARQLRQQAFKLQAQVEAAEKAVLEVTQQTQATRKLIEEQQQAAAELAAQQEQIALESERAEAEALQARQQAQKAEEQEQQARQYLQQIESELEEMEGVLDTRETTESPVAPVDGAAVDGAAETP